MSQENVEIVQEVFRAFKRAGRRGSPSA